MKAVICAIAKYEYNYIREWVEYHINLGFDKIVIYDNNDIDGERYDELLSDFIKNEQVELRDVRGKLAMQRIVYNEFYKEGDFDWVAIIDIDEFITPNKTKYKNIKDFIEKNSFADAIYLYWQTYGDAGKTFPTKSNKPISILKQYNVPANKNSLIDSALKRQNVWGKSIIKANLPITYLHEHFVTDPNNLNYVDCYGEKVSPYLFYPDEKRVENTYKECYIKHIYTKSLYEYIDCKVRRPAANSFGEMHFPSKYFKVNEINEEKRQYMESIGYKMDFIFKPDAYIVVEVKNFIEYTKLRPYIMNLIELCSCRFNLCVTEEAEAVNKISEDIAKYFNECSIYYLPKNNVISEFCNVYYKEVENIINHSNCIVHLNIAYNVDIDEYIRDFIDPIFNKDSIKSNFMKVFNTESCMYISQNSISTIDTKSEDYQKFLSIIKSNVNYSQKLVAFTGNFIIKTKDVLKYKKEFLNNAEVLSKNPLMMLFFISNMVATFLFTRNK